MNFSQVYAPMLTQAHPPTPAPPPNFEEPPSLM